MRDVSPVGLERCLHTAEVTGSSPVRPTKRADITDACSFFSSSFIVFHRFIVSSPHRLIVVKNKFLFLPIQI